MTLLVSDEHTTSVVPDSGPYLKYEVYCMFISMSTSSNIPPYMRTVEINIEKQGEAEAAQHVKNFKSKKVYHCTHRCGSNSSHVRIRGGK